MRYLATLLSFALSASLAAEFNPPEVRNVPVERLAANLQRQVRQNPLALDARINLARVYAMAYAQKVERIPASGNEAQGWKPWFTDELDQPHQQFEVKAARDPKVQAAAKANLARAIATYRSAVQQDPNHMVALIGLGWCLLQAQERAEAIPVLRKAVEAGWAYESSPTASFYAVGRSIVEEAAHYLIPLLDKERDAAEIARLRERLKKLESVRRPITPIVIPLRNGLTAADLVDEEAEVVFDLDGTGPKRWMWITSDAAWLVYDRFGEGRITSGLQLFGNVTFWAFWQNGYEALAPLDDDGDGEVRGAELRGFALWHDRNLNGVSERGEVRPVAAWGIEALSTGYRFDATQPDEIPWSREGVRFSDGTVRPTFDVVLRRR